MLPRRASQLLVIIEACLLPAGCLRAKQPASDGTEIGRTPPNETEISMESGRGTGKFGGQACGGKPYEAPRCAACRLNGPAAPSVLVLSRGDGLGERALAMIFAMAWAEGNGFNFGGVIDKKCPTSHGIDTHRALSSLFGEDADSLFLSSPPHLDEEYRNWHPLQHNLKKLRKRRNINIGLTSSKMYEWMDKIPPASDRFMQALRKGARFLKHGPFFTGPNLKVALHVRRDDISSDPGTHGAWRFTPDEWYFKLVEKLQEAMNVRMDVHVFSSTGRGYTLEDFAGFQARNWVLHVNADVLETWSMMAQADILVMAQSSFSFIPGLFNRGCVLDMRHFLPADSDWRTHVSFISVEEDIAYLDSPEFSMFALPTCVVAASH